MDIWAADADSVEETLEILEHPCRSFRTLSCAEQTFLAIVMLLYCPFMFTVGLLWQVFWRIPRRKFRQRKSCNRDDTCDNSWRNLRTGSFRRALLEALLHKDIQPINRTSNPPSDTLKPKASWISFRSWRSVKVWMNESFPGHPCLNQIPCSPLQLLSMPLSDFTT